jgi:tetratricopeptide (TPR) repeat protein
VISQKCAGSASVICSCLLVQVWRELALAYAGQHQVKDAELCVQHAQQLQPHSAATYHAIGAVAAAGGDSVAAKQAYKAALALDAAYAPALLSLGEQHGSAWLCLLCDYAFVCDGRCGAAVWRSSPLLGMCLG